MREIVIDTETTGLDPLNGDRVVEIGAVELVNRSLTGQTFHRYVCPQRAMPADALAVYGLTAEFLADKPLFGAVADEFLAFVGDAPLVAHNAGFDIAFLNAELTRAAKPPIATERVIDTLVLAGRKHPAGHDTLDDLCSRYGVDSLRSKHVVLADMGTSSAGTAGLRMPNGVAVIGQSLWAAVGYALPALLGTLLAAPRRRQLLFIGDGAFQMTAQELSTILRRGLKPIIFLVNNNGYTIERLILGPSSRYNDINQWRYAEAASFFDTQDQAIAYMVRTEDELEDALAAARDREALMLIELVMSRLDAPASLVNFAQKCAEFNFPRLATLLGYGP
jgi:DNA polymerase III epsilon subunit family exonuclease